MGLLHNDTIRLRALEPEDIEMLYRWENDTSQWQNGSTLTPYSKFILHEYIQSATTDIYQNKQLRLMVTFTQNKEAIGTIDLYDFDAFHRRAGVGILIDSKYRNCGYGSMVLEIIANYAFSFLHLHQLYAHIPLLNEESLRLFKQNGYVAAGTLIDWCSSAHGYDDVAIMQLLNEKE